MLKAGYPLVSAKANMSRAIVSAGTQRAKSQLETARLDRAQQIERLAGEEIVKSLPEMADQTKALLWAKAYELKQNAPPEEEKAFLPPSYLRERRRRKAMRHRH